MSHFTVLVAADDHDDLEQKLAPYDEEADSPNYLDFTPFDSDELADFRKDWADREDKSEYKTFHSYMTSYYSYTKRDGVYGRMRNSCAKWDWWVVGGRWSGLLKLKQGATGENGEGGAMNDPNHDPGYADIAAVDDVDWEAMRNQRTDEARMLWHQWRPIKPLRLAWTEASKIAEGAYEIRKEKGEDDEAAVAVHEAAKEVAEAARKVLVTTEHEAKIFVWDSEKIDDLSALDEEEYVVKHGSSDALTHAFIDLDGEWHEDSQMGWWGITYDVKEGYREQYWAFIEALSPDQLLFVVDCHI